jgi:hypothetical protein
MTKRKKRLPMPDSDGGSCFNGMADWAAKQLGKHRKRKKRKVRR